jgi:hypothetical protein
MKFRTKKLVLSVGAWAPEIYGGDILDNLHVERRVLYWFKTASEDYAQKFEVLYSLL